ncbi:hypothetical protein R5R35_011307 [Gryllus longicercus]|uniref:Sulfotransferase domain-containing protein n=1 Tax=Gryllus longicercus TaxID=2509291 RepID=A0AAN9ZF08_9ORTH
MVVASPTSTLPATRGATAAAAAGPSSFIRDARRVIRRAERPGRGVASMAVSEAVSVSPLEGERVRKLLGLLKLGNEPQARFGPTGCVLAARFADSLGDIRAFEVRDDDVWVVTPPKCGTTWTQEMVYLLLNDLNYEEAKKAPLYKRSPFFEYTRFAPKEIIEEEMDIDTLEHATTLPSPRCIKSHLHKPLLPEQLWTKKAKVVYVAREPKDTAVSFYHHYKLLSGYTGDKDFFFECFYEGLVEHSPLWEHVLEFWKIKDQPNILFNTYEEMKEDLPAVVQRTAKFLGKSLTEAQLTRLVEHLDIKQMKRNPATNYEDLFTKAREEGRISDDQAFIRKGVVGEGRREMSPEMAARFDERTRRVFNEAVGGCPWQI